MEKWLRELQIAQYIYEGNNMGWYPSPSNIEAATRTIEELLWRYI
jgi:hypothetical protein